MRKINLLLLLGIVLSSTLSGCGTSSSVAPTLTTAHMSPTPTRTLSTPTLPPTPVLTIPTLTPFPKGETIIVTSADDSGPGTLDQAIQDARPGDIITFDIEVFPPDKPTTIFIETTYGDNALPILSQGALTIDASNAGVILDGSKSHRNWITGLTISSDGNTIQGLQIVNFSGSGIAICTGSYNKIGGDRGMGSGPLGQGNLISQNGIGIDLCDWGDNNIITGNIIGSDTSGFESWGNVMAGIEIENGVTNTLVGPDNIIAFNGTYGVQISGVYTTGSKISQNSIHDNSKGGINTYRDGKATVPPPFPLSIDLVKGSLMGSSCPGCRIEIFSDDNIQGTIYEGYTTVDAKGIFRFDKFSSFTGPRVNVLAINNEGDTSQFSASAALFQDGNTSPGKLLDTFPSKDLDDNRIGAIFADLYHPEKNTDVFPNNKVDTNTILSLGLKRIRLSVNNDIDSERIDWTSPELSVDPIHDQFITDLASNGVEITLVLTFWDKDYVANGGELGIPRFKTEGEIQRYLDFVRLTVSHFKDRVEYYEIWNEPDYMNTVQWIKVEDYLNLVRRTIPVIRQEYPNAKIVVGGIPILLYPEKQQYLFSILYSDVMPLVDGVAWHPFYGTSPETDHFRQDYYSYPTLVKRIKDEAGAHGFQGEYFADELTWRTQGEGPWLLVYSTQVVAKYLARSIVLHLGMNIAVTQNGHHPVDYWRLMQNLSTIMAGAKPVDLSVIIESDILYISHYAFSLPNGDELLAIWNDGAAIDYDPGIPSTLTLSGYAGQKATGVDVINGFEQLLVSGNENGDLVIHDFLLKDYPMIIRLSK